MSTRSAIRRMLTTGAGAALTSPVLEKLRQAVCPGWTATQSWTCVRGSGLTLMRPATRTDHVQTAQEQGCSNLHRVMVRLELGKKLKLNVLSVPALPKRNRRSVSEREADEVCVILDLFYCQTCMRVGFAGDARRKFLLTNPGLCLSGSVLFPVVDVVTGVIHGVDVLAGLSLVIVGDLRAWDSWSADRSMCDEVCDEAIQVRAFI